MEDFECQTMAYSANLMFLCPVLPEKNISSLDSKGIPSDSCVSFCTLCIKWDTKQFLIIQSGNNYELSFGKTRSPRKSRGK